MRPNDKIGIVVYDTTASISLEHTTDKERVLEVIDALYTKGSTNAEAGLILGYKQANKYFESEKVNRVILLSDGVANVGNTDSSSILSQLKSYKNKGIAMTAVGVGMGNYNDVLLEQIADKADGNYAYINDITEAKRLFSKQFSSTIQTVAYDAKIQVEFDENTVKRYRLIGYENRELADEAFEANIEDAGEIGAGHEVTAIYEIELEGAGNIGNVRFRYEDVDTLEVQELSKNIGSNVLSFESSSNGFKKSIAVARFAQILKLVQPPPTIDIVYEILESLDLKDETDIDFMMVVYNAQKLIEDKR